MPSVLRVVPAFRRSLDQVVAHAAAWEEHNAAVLAAPGSPLYVAVGDSTAQGIGVASIDASYPAQVRALLEGRDSRPWQLLNLSKSGAVLADVLDVQLPRLRALGVRPDLLSAVVGGNDLRRTALPELLTGLERLVTALPVGSLVATMPRGLKEKEAEVANALLTRLAQERGLLVADLWSHTGPPWRGKYADGLHPNAVGLQEWVAALRAPLGL